MPALPIIEYPNPRLRGVTAPVDTGRFADPAFQRLLDDMLQT
ncbi:MAG: peptide deformylase, partial [Gammaproteobacteria bacterium]|nr:peptide deformylase [Gammaproteobacteria bacterium]